MVESQSIPKITSNPCRGREIRFTLYLHPFTSTRHLVHKDDVLIKPEAGVDTASWHYSSHTSILKRSTHASDTKECVTPKS